MEYCNNSFDKGYYHFIYHRQHSNITAYLTDLHFRDSQGGLNLMEFLVRAPLVASLHQEL